MRSSTGATIASDTGRGTSALARARTWILLEGDRVLIAGALLLVIFILFVLLELVQFMTTGGNAFLAYLFSGLVGGNLTLLTVVLAINQLILSRQLKPLGQAYSEIQDIIEYQRDVEGAVERQVVPITPPEFVTFVLRIIRQQAQTVSERNTEADERELRDELTTFVEELTTRIDDGNESIERSDGEIFDVLLVLLRMEVSRPIRQVRQLRANHREKLSEADHEALEDLGHRLQQLGAAQQYFQTVYVQDELAKLSRYLLYVGFPAVLISMVTLVAFTPSVSQASSLLLTPSGTQSTVWIVRSVYLNGVMAIGLAPLAVLSAYVLRVAVIAQSSAITTPFSR